MPNFIQVGEGGLLWEPKYSKISPIWGLWGQDTPIQVKYDAEEPILGLISNVKLDVLLQNKLSPTYSFWPKYGDMKHQL